jgi:hypothetical protein
MKVIQAVCAASLCIALLGSCASAPRAPFTEVDEMAAVAPGTRNIRYLADAPANAYKGARHAIVQQGRPSISRYPGAAEAGPMAPASSMAGRSLARGRSSQRSPAFRPGR